MHLHLPASRHTYLYIFLVATVTIMSSVLLKSLAVAALSSEQRVQGSDGVASASPTLLPLTSKVMSYSLAVPKAMPAGKRVRVENSSGGCTELEEESYVETNAVEEHISNKKVRTVTEPVTHTGPTTVAAGTDAASDNELFGGRLEIEAKAKTEGSDKRKKTRYRPKGKQLQRQWRQRRNQRHG